VNKRREFITEKEGKDKTQGQPVQLEHPPFFHVESRGGSPKKEREKRENNIDHLFHPLMSWRELHLIAGSQVY
jgi:hypothetical protein